MKIKLIGLEPYGILILQRNDIGSRTNGADIVKFQTWSESDFLVHGMRIGGEIYKELNYHKMTILI